MAIKLDIQIAHKKWGTKKSWNALLQKVILEISKRFPEKLPQNAQVALLLTNDEHIQSINAQWRNKDMPTNVLSFPSGPNFFPFLGDIAMAYETVANEAQMESKPFLEHAQHLFVHGVLHLLHFDHLNEDEAQEMEAHEIAILFNLGIPNPYVIK